MHFCIEKIFNLNLHASKVVLDVVIKRLILFIANLSAQKAGKRDPRLTAIRSYEDSVRCLLTISDLLDKKKL